MRTKVCIWTLFVTIVLIVSSNSEVKAQVHVVRSGQENPVITIGKSTLYGAATGVLLGLALTLVVDEPTGDVLKWSFVGGTFGGFILGVYHVATRPQPSSAMLQLDSGGLAKMTLPKPQFRFNNRALEFRVNVVSFSL